MNSVNNPSRKILILGGALPPSRLVDAFISKKCDVHYTDERIDEDIAYDLVVSFGYRHILRSNVIEGAGCPIFNLHISYLPFNRGAHPNFWSFYEGTPAGVTIHLIDEGVDTGDIVYQKAVKFDRNESSFAETYARLIEEVENLLLTNIDEVLYGTWVATPQQGRGTFHAVDDLPTGFSGWDANINDEVKRLSRIHKAQ